MAVRTTVVLKGEKAVIDNLRKNAEKIILAGMDAVNSGLEILEKGMKEDCPVNTDSADTDTLHLRESIRSVKGAMRMKNKIIGKVGPSKLTAMHVEFGTQYMFPRVFMRSQLYKQKDKIRNMAKEIIKRKVGL